LLGYNDRGVLAGVNFIFVPDTSGIDRVGQDVIDMATSKRLSAFVATIRFASLSGFQSKLVGFISHFPNCAVFCVEII